MNYKWFTKKKSIYTHASLPSVCLCFPQIEWSFASPFYWDHSSSFSARSGKKKTWLFPAFSLPFIFLLAHCLLQILTASPLSTKMARPLSRFAHFKRKKNFAFSAFLLSMLPLPWTNLYFSQQPKKQPNVISLFLVFATWEKVPPLSSCCMAFIANLGATSRSQLASGRGMSKCGWWETCTGAACRS